MAISILTQSTAFKQKIGLDKGGAKAGVDHISDQHDGQILWQLSTQYWSSVLRNSRPGITVASYERHGSEIAGKSTVS